MRAINSGGGRKPRRVMQCGIAASTAAMLVASTLPPTPRAWPSSTAKVSRRTLSGRRTSAGSTSRIPLRAHVMRRRQTPNRTHRYAHALVDFDGNSLRLEFDMLPTDVQWSAATYPESRRFSPSLTTDFSAFFFGCRGGDIFARCTPLTTSSSPPDLICRPPPDVRDDPPCRATAVGFEWRV